MQEHYPWLINYSSPFLVQLTLYSVYERPRVKKIWRGIVQSEKTSSSSSPFFFVSSSSASSFSVARTMTAGFLIRSRRATRWKKEEFWPAPGAWEATFRVRCCRYRNLTIGRRSLENLVFFSYFLLVSNFDEHLSSDWYMVKCFSKIWISPIKFRPYSDSRKYLYVELTYIISYYIKI